MRSAVRRDLRSALAGEPAGSTAVPPLPLVLVACSGGPDSLALAAALAAEADAPTARVRAGAVVVDHGWHPGSAAVAGRTVAVLTALGLDPVVLHRVGSAGPGGPEARARRGRHAALARAAAEHGAVAVLLGHTRDDQAEQVLLGLARGSGARSLAGMPAVRALLRRPLLGLGRATTVAACAEAGLSPWHDPSNADPARARSRVRASTLPTLERDLGPGVAAALVRTADQLREDADALDALAADLAARAVSTTVRTGTGTGTGGPGGATADGRDGAAVEAGAGADREVVVALAALVGAPAALLTRVLRTAALRAGCPAQDLTRGHVTSLVALTGLPGPAGQPGLADRPGPDGPTRSAGPSGAAAGRLPTGPLHLPGRIAAQRRCGTLRLWTQRT